jgi:hypothetical protein
MYHGYLLESSVIRATIRRCGARPKLGRGGGENVRQLIALQPKAVPR